MTDHRSRGARVLEGLGATECDALLVTNLTNVRYLTGFSGSNAQLLLTRGGAIFFSDPRYAARAGDLVDGADIHIYQDALSDVLPEHLNTAGVTKLGIEADTMTVGELDRLGERLPGIRLEWTQGIVENVRRVKDAEEISFLKRAVELSDEAFRWALDRIVPGVTERQLALDLEVKMRQSGADDVSFEPIVGAGTHSAHIHHTPSERAAEKGDLVLIDMGARFNGYCSDLTRTVVVGPATDDQRRIYELVLEAQTAGIRAISVGASGIEVDARARDVISSAGYGESFGHGLGHGVGLDIHEAPRLHRTSADTLVASDVVTVEPGVYLPGSGGIRIEDIVVVTENGAEVLGHAPKDSLIEL
ncbi:MAG: Xaa-Pro aminopeptidase [Actinomycetota bacterium]|jgi:Xaa-Pro aminopeptidase|nr:Xaa-Pro aminopeptidase [Actinomycetota bacterium]